MKEQNCEKMEGVIVKAQYWNRDETASGASCDKSVPVISTNKKRIS